MKRTAPLLALAALALAASSAMAQVNLVQNPSFETVSAQTINGVALTDAPTSWTQTGSNGCGFESLATGQTPTNGGDFTIGTNADNPSNGARILISDMGPSNVTCQVFQDVAIPAGASSAILSLDAGYTFINSGTPGSSVSVAVTTTGGVPLASVYTRTDVQGNDPLATRTVNLNAFRGQTVRIIGTVTVPASNWSGLELDNVRLLAVVAPAAVPTLSPWSVAALCILLGLAGAWAMRTSRRA